MLFKLDRLEERRSNALFKKKSFAGAFISLIGESMALSGVKGFLGGFIALN